MSTEKKMTGYPSIDKPWLKHYTEEAINAQMPSGNMYEYIFESNKGHLEDIALVYFGKKISYGELFLNIEKTVGAFKAIGVNAGDVVSFISITTPELVYCVYALNRIGAVANMLDPRSPEKTLVSQIANADSKVLVIMDQCIDLLRNSVKQLMLDHIILIKVKTSMGFPVKQMYSIKTVFDKKNSRVSTCKYTEWKDFLKTSSAERDSLPVEVANSPAFIWYTGGTTGESKGVLLSNLNINSVAEQYRLVAKEHARQQTWLTVSAPFVAYSLICGLHLPLAFGMTCCIELYDPGAMAETIVKKRYNHAAVTPIVWEKMIKNSKFANENLSFLIAPISGADYMSPKLEQEINNYFATHNCTWNICQGYGMTEVGSGVAVCSSKDCYKPGSVGIPFPKTIISTFDVDNGQELPIGEIGEICVCGPSIMLEYYKNTEATNAVIKQHSDGMRWMHTGDCGRIDEDGNLFITGRIKRMITRFDGFKIFPSSIEEKIMTHQAIEKCCVVGKKDSCSEGGQLPMAFFVIKKEIVTPYENIIEEVRDICKRELPEYAQPVDFIFIDKMPLTPIGKVDYRVLEKEAERL